MPRVTGRSPPSTMRRQQDQPHQRETARASSGRSRPRADALRPDQTRPGHRCRSTGTLSADVGDPGRARGEHGTRRRRPRRPRGEHSGQAEWDRQGSHGVAGEWPSRGPASSAVGEVAGHRTEDHPGHRIGADHDPDSEVTFAERPLHIKRQHLAALQSGSASSAAKIPVKPGLRRGFGPRGGVHRRGWEFGITGLNRLRPPDAGRGIAGVAS